MLTTEKIARDESARTILHQSLIDHSSNHTQITSVLLK